MLSVHLRSRMILSGIEILRKRSYVNCHVRRPFSPSLFLTRLPRAHNPGLKGVPLHALLLSRNYGTSGGTYVNLLIQLFHLSKRVGIREIINISLDRRFTVLGLLCILLNSGRRREVKGQGQQYSQHSEGRLPSLLPHRFIIVNSSLPCGLTSRIVMTSTDCGLLFERTDRGFLFGI